MSVYRKESNSLVPKAGLGIIDNIFNRFSNHAISNAKTTEALILRNVMYDESDGKLYKVGIDGTKGDEIKMGMPIYDFANYLHVFASTAPSGMPSGATYGLTYTLSKDAYLVGSMSADSGKTSLTIDGTVVGETNSYGVGSGFIELKVKAGSTITVSVACPRLHVYDIEE